MKEIKFTVPGEPKGKGRPRVTRNCNGKSVTYTPRETVRYENAVRSAYLRAGGETFEPHEALEVKCVFFLPIAKSVSKKKLQKMLAHEILPTKKPDADNVVKAILDALNKLAFHDDSQVCDLHIAKRYSDRPRAEIMIRTIL